MSGAKLEHFSTPTLSIACEVSGPTHGRPTLLLHGWPDDARTWDRVLPALHAAGCRTIVPYLRGFGPTRFRSPQIPRNGQLAALGQDVLDLADAIKLQTFAAVGHDWGARAAYIASALAADRVTHCVALSVGWDTNDPGQRLPLKQVQNYWYHWYFSLPRGIDLLRSSRRELCRFMWETWSPTWRFLEADYEATAASFENPDWADITLHSYRHRWGYAQGDPRYSELELRLSTVPLITVPTLMLHGGADACNDPLTSTDKEKYFTNRYKRQVLPNVGHFPQREDSETVANEIITWLRA